MNWKVSQFYVRQWIKRRKRCKDGQFKERYAGKVKFFIKMVSAQELWLKSAVAQDSLQLCRAAKPSSEGQESKGTEHEIASWLGDLSESDTLTLILSDMWEASTLRNCG